MAFGFVLGNIGRCNKSASNTWEDLAKSIKYKSLIILVCFGYMLKTKYRNLAIFTHIFSHIYLLKTSNITLFLNFKLHFLAKFRQYTRLSYTSTFLLSIFWAKFWPGIYDFNVFKWFFMGKMTQIHQLLMNFWKMITLLGSQE